MKPSDFKIGDEFQALGIEAWWRAVDIGQHGITAIRLNAPDESWYVGPPYAVPVRYWDQYGIDGIAMLRRDGVETEVEPDVIGVDE